MKALTHDPDSAAMRALGHTRLVLDALPCAVVVADLEGTILAANAVARRVYELDASEPVGRSIKEFFSSATAAEVANIIGLVRSGSDVVRRGARGTTGRHDRLGVRVGCAAQGRSRRGRRVHRRL